GELALLTRHGVPQRQGLDLVLAADAGDLAVPRELDLRVVERAVGHDLRRAELVTTVDQRDLVREAREERGLLHRGVAAAHDGDVLVAEEEAVARGAPRDAAAGQALLVVETELTV